MLAVFFTTFIFLFFVLIGIIFIVGWQSIKDNNILGGVLLMWIVVALFLLVVFWGGRNRETEEPITTGFAPGQLALEAKT